MLSRALHSLPKTAKRPERPYGGERCSSCMRRLIIEQTRK
jgi:ribosomal protein L34E